jgi:hypothetical protein
MLFDTDVLIWLLRGNTRAAKAADQADSRAISVIAYMELIQGAMDKTEVRWIRSFLSDQAFRMVPLTPDTGTRASIYMEEHSLASSLDLADALIAASAVEENEPLLTGNDKHYRIIRDLQLLRFRP